jgi:hypothetical protein
MKLALLIATCLCAHAAHAGDFVYFAGFEDTQPPVTGSVIVTEIMSNPVDVADASGEWFELANVSDQLVDLGACSVGHDVTQNALPAHALSAGSFAVVARSTNTVDNGNVPAFATFAFGLGSSGTIDLTCEGRLIDEVTWSSESAGHSRSLDPQFFNAVDNDNDMRWCFTTQVYDVTDTGTPGAGNAGCPAG